VALASGNRASAEARRVPRVPVPGTGTQPPHPILSPLLSVVPGQLFAGALAHAKGLDADYPVGLSKVTRAR
jgi:glutamine---fructose-6-phosphate transaminase (isomerizing)